MWPEGHELLVTEKARASHFWKMLPRKLQGLLQAITRNQHWLKGIKLRVSRYIWWCSFACILKQDNIASRKTRGTFLPISEHVLYFQNYSSLKNLCINCKGSLKNNHIIPLEAARQWHHQCTLEGMLISPHMLRCINEGLAKYGQCDRFYR